MRMEGIYALVCGEGDSGPTELRLRVSGSRRKERIRVRLRAHRRVDRVNATDSKRETAVSSVEKTADHYVRPRDDTVSRPNVPYRNFEQLVKTSCGEELRDLRGRCP